MTMYADLALVANDLLTEFGQAVTIRTQTAGAYNPETGAASITSVDQTGSGAVFDFGLHQSGSEFAAGSLILGVLLSPVGISAPEPGSLAIIGADTWNIISVKATAQAGTAVIYECQLRK